MAPAATATMAKKKHKLVDPNLIPQASDERRPEECEYVSVKIDNELPRVLRRAAANLGISVQELMSDALNLIAASLLDEEPIRRRTPPSRGRP